jgi:hypothetical protein
MPLDDRLDPREVASQQGAKRLRIEPFPQRCRPGDVTEQHCHRLPHLATGSSLEESPAVGTTREPLRGLLATARADQHKARLEHRAATHKIRGTVLGLTPPHLRAAYQEQAEAALHHELQQHPTHVTARRLSTSLVTCQDACAAIRRQEGSPQLPACDLFLCQGERRRTAAAREPPPTARGTAPVTSSTRHCVLRSSRSSRTHAAVTASRAGDPRSRQLSYRTSRPGGVNDARHSTGAKTDGLAGLIRPTS